MPYMVQRWLRRRWPAMLLLGTLACASSDGDGPARRMPGTGGNGGSSGSGGSGSGGSGVAGASGGTGAGKSDAGMSDRAACLDVLCKGDEVCVAGLCKPLVGCKEDSHCDDKERCCALGACIPEETCCVSADCEGGMVCDGSVCVPGGCGENEFETESVPPNVMFVMDKSKSMQAGTGGVSMAKWVVAVDAVDSILTSFTGQARWGLILFPDTACSNVITAFPIADGQEAMIQAYLNAARTTASPLYPSNAPSGVTDIDVAIATAAADPALLDPDRSSYLVLITDGKQSSTCGGAAGDTRVEIAIADLEGVGVHTYVVGFDAASDAAQLDTFAQLGGVPSPGPTDYYPAQDAAGLMMALDGIAKSVATSCEFDLADMPPNSADLYAFLDNLPVTRDDPDGWRYDELANRVIFEGKACDEIKSTANIDIDVVWGCPEPVPD